MKVPARLRCNRTARASPRCASGWPFILTPILATARVGVFSCVYHQRCVPIHALCRDRWYCNTSDPRPPL
nr:MAG TPA_asm: hypothetical protein [Caudoviricetes sp.]